MRILNNVFPALTFLALSGICSAASIVSNGGFETGSLSDWTMSGDSTYTNVQSVFPHSGQNEAHIGAYGDSGYGYLTQTIATTPGSSYTLSFAYGEYNTNDPGYLLPENVNTTDPSNPYFQDNALSVQWNGSVVFSDAKFFASDNGAITQGSGFYKLGTVTLQATGTSSDLSFGAFDRQQDVVLDDVSISSAVSSDAQAPEPATWGLLGSALIGLGLLRRKNGNSLA
jgi:hypothetical protein